MADIQHNSITLGNIHQIVNWEWPDSNARLAEPVTNADVYKIGIQTNTNSLYVLINTVPTWEKLLRVNDGATPIGPAGGDLSGVYPSPSVVNDSHNHTPGVTIPAYPTTLPPSGNANSADITGTYPNPVLTTTGVTPGTYNRATVTVNNKGRITSITANTDPPPASTPFPGFANAPLTGVSTTETPPYRDNSNRIANTKYVTNGQIRNEELPSGEYLEILVGRQKVVHKVYTIRGTLKVGGTFIIDDHSNTLTTPNFLPAGGPPLVIPENHFLLRVSGFRVAGTIINYGTLKII